jgi:hypothetical protein
MFDPILQLPDVLSHLRQVLYHAVSPPAHVCINGRRAQNDFIVRNVVNDARLSGDSNIIADVYMADDAALSADRAMVSDRVEPAIPTCATSRQCGPIRVP